ncbi:hypothetical protein [Dyella thiooxydans]|uniref:hypothetical protein n=1 Tax=Dyella thiooxydans TaxID=445710 RepID=UPI0012FBF048|nr:hypothetical protein [Dyella thiooxydans]
MKKVRFRWSALPRYLAAVAVGFVTAFWVAGAAEGWLSRSDAPAWVQAVGSIVGILVAAAIPTWDARVKRAAEKRHLIALLGTLGNELRDFGTEVLSLTQDDAKLVGVAEFGSRDEFEPLVAALDKFPGHLLSDPSHISTLLMLQRLSLWGDRLWKFACDHGGGGDDSIDWGGFGDFALQFCSEAEDAADIASRFR